MTRWFRRKRESDFDRTWRTINDPTKATFTAEPNGGFTATWDLPDGISGFDPEKVPGRVIGAGEIEDWFTFILEDPEA